MTDTPDTTSDEQQERLPDPPLETPPNPDVQSGQDDDEEQDDDADAPDDQ
jgi:hypothetical protein